MSDETRSAADGEAPADADGPMAHWVNPAPFDPHAAEGLTPAERRRAMMGQWQLIWRKFRRHRLAVASGLFLLVLYVLLPVAEIVAPYGFGTRHTDYLDAPPMEINWVHEGEFVGPFVYGYDVSLDRTRMAWDYAIDRSEVMPLRVFCTADDYPGARYEFWGLLETSVHLVCPAAGGYFFPLGTDRLGRDMLSRIVQGARVSLTVGLIGVAISFALGLTFGGAAGYYGGLVDAGVQRLIEVVRSFPALPLWMALSAAMPVTWSPVVVFMGISAILGLLDWPGLARAVRSKLLALREEDFVTAAELMGAPPRRVIVRHLLPSFSSHLIASATLTIPAMILGETALSFLGLGLRPPVTSWGVLLNEAQNFNAIVNTPWLLYPAIPVILVVLAFQFLGDGLRDAADPYA